MKINISSSHTPKTSRAKKEEENDTLFSPKLPSTPRLPVSKSRKEKKGKYKFKIRDSKNTSGDLSR
jgi:hypothetical protein